MVMIGHSTIIVYCNENRNNRYKISKKESNRADQQKKAQTKKKKLFHNVNLIALNIEKYKSKGIRLYKYTVADQARFKS